MGISIIGRLAKRVISGVVLGTGAGLTITQASDTSKVVTDTVTENPTLTLVFAAIGAVFALVQHLKKEKGQPK